MVDPLPEPARAFADLAPMVAHLRWLQRYCRPFGSDYSALAISLAALDEAAEVMTGKEAFFGAQKDAVGAIRPRS